MSGIPVVFRNCILFCVLLSGLLFLQTLTPWNRRSGKNKIYLADVSNLLPFHKHKLPSPSLLIVFTIYFLFLRMTGWIFILLFYSCGIEHTVCKGFANKFSGLQKSFSFPVNLLSRKKSHSSFEITTYSP